ncbi:MAG: AAA family ATPase [Candidatus Bipolaricaulia bacterium]
MNDEPSLLDLMKDEGDKAGEPEALDPDRDLEIAMAPSSLRDLDRDRDRMRIVSVELSNFMCYKQEQVSFETGTTIIAGPNGSGKSSLLESIFFALYGSKASPVMGRPLHHILREAARSGHVELTFDHGEHRYTVRMGMRRSGSSVISEREGCWLERDDGQKWVGVENVTTAIEEQLGMDRDDFVNCIYIRQGEIDRLIKAGEEERKRMIDRLLRLERLDDYVTRAKQGARRAVNRQRDVVKSKLNDIETEIADLEGESLEQKRAELERRLDEIRGELKDLDARIEGAERRRAEHHERLKRIDAAKQELETTEASIAEKEDRLQEQLDRQKELTLEIEELQLQHQEMVSDLGGMLWAEEGTILEALETAAGIEEVPEFRIELAERQAEVESLQTQRQALRDQVTRLESERKRLTDTSTDIDTQLESDKEGLAQARDQLEAERSQQAALEEQIKGQEAAADEKLPELTVELPAPKRFSELDLKALRDQVTEQLATVAEVQEAVKERLVERRTQQAEIDKELSNKEQLVEAGRCPTCGQAVTEETFTDTLHHLEIHRNELTQKISNDEEQLADLTGRIEGLKADEQAVNQLELIGSELRGIRARLEERVVGIEQDEREIETRETQIEGHKERRERTEEELHATEERGKALEAQITDLNRRFDEVEAQLNALEEVKALANRAIRLRDRTINRKEMRSGVRERIDDLRRDLEMLRAKHFELTQELEVGDRTELEEQLKVIEDHVAELTGRREQLGEERDGLVHRRGTVESRIEMFQKRKEQQEMLHNKAERFDRIAGELDEIIETYGVIKREFRKRNLEALNLYFERFFTLMDSGDSYSGVQIDDDYGIQVFLKNGEAIHPAILSGGERALINIALRAAIHQVLSRAITRTPLILDEPTIYLDRSRIQRLQRLLEDLGRRIGQVILVSHDAALVESADHEYHARKRSDNISVIEQVR